MQNRFYGAEDSRRFQRHIQNPVTVRKSFNLTLNCLLDGNDNIGGLLNSIDTEMEFPITLETLEKWKKNEYCRGKCHSNTCGYVYVIDIFLGLCKASMVELFLKIVNV